ncbi:hypothetical protein LCGC14_1883150 [marine sediment metagenome]|uniref:Uncharacterized protein n=1 Tax=marine sediment metagenome TaxID=412755 RepID=A0A0F9IZZ5_9ZZZZ
MSYIVPTNELTLTDIKAFRGNAINRGIERALKLGLASNPNELVVRDAFPHADLGLAATNGWLTENFISFAIPAANAWSSAFDSGALPGTQIQLGATQIAVFYKFADTEDAPVVNGVRFRLGAAGATTLASFYLQLPTQSKIEPDVYFTEPVVYDPQSWLYIEIYPTGNIGGQEQIPFGCFIIEPTGGTVS